MASRARNWLKTIFITGYKPTQDDFADVFDSFVNKTDDTQITIDEKNKIDALPTRDELTIDLNSKVDKSGTDRLITVIESTKLAGLQNETATSIITKIGDGSKISAAYLPSYVDDVIEGIWVSTIIFQVANVTITPETGKLYISTDTNLEYRWSGSIYVQLVASPGTTDSVTEGSTNKYFTEARTLNAILTGVATYFNNIAVLATDSILVAIGKLQGQITAIKTTLGTLKALATKDQADWNTDIANKPSIPVVEDHTSILAKIGSGGITETYLAQDIIDKINAAL